MEIPFDDVNNDQPSLRMLKAYYKINKVIGKGAFGTVFKAFELCSGRRVAIKQIKIDSNNKNLVLKEIDVLKKVEHPNIVNYYNFLKEDNYIFIIMEFLEGGTLKEYIQENANNITEDIAREIIKQIFNALSYLHYSCDVCHRDIKPENIMFSEKNNISSIKLLDFGLSSDSFESQLRLHNCGTLVYMAPEQISGVIYSKAVDVWSVGIILYMLLNKGKNNFYNKGDESKLIIDKINNKEIEFDLNECPISPIGRHLIYKLLDKNPSYRYSARLALIHPWITKNKFDKIPMTLYDKLLLDENGMKLKTFFLVATFIRYYKNNFLGGKKILKYNICKSEKTVSGLFKNKFRKLNSNLYDEKNYQNLSPKEKEKNKILFNFEDYENKVIKTNKIQEEKYLEIKDKMFSNEYKDDKDFIFLNIIKLDIFKNQKENKDKNNKLKDKNLKINVTKENNNENNIESIKKEKDLKDLNNNSPQKFASINANHKLPYKAMLKNSVNHSPVGIHQNDQSFKEQGKTPDINWTNKKYGKKLSSKLISFRLSMDQKHQKNKYVIIQNGKDKLEKPIKLQSLKNTSNFLLNKAKNNKTLITKDILVNNNHSIFETINSKSKLTKNVEKLKKYSSMEKIERNYKALKHLKGSNSFEGKKNIDLENNDNKKLIYKSVKIKDEFKDLDEKLNMDLLKVKQKELNQAKLSKSSLTSAKKTRTGRSNSINDSRIIRPKKLFQNNNSNYILPPIKK